MNKNKWDNYFSIIPLVYKINNKMYQNKNVKYKREVQSIIFYVRNISRLLEILWFFQEKFA